MARISGGAPRSTSIAFCKASDARGLSSVLLGLALLVWLAFRGWSVLLLAPLAALLAAGFAGEPLLAHWTQTFMGSAAHFLAQFFPLFLLGALFGKLMEDSGSVAAIAGWMTERLGADRAMLAVVLAGALVTYGGVSLFVAFFVLAPMAEALFRGAAPAPTDAGSDCSRHLNRMIGGTSARAARWISTGSNACAVVVRSRTIGSSAAASTGTDEALPKPSPRRRAAAAARSSHHSPKLSIMAAAITPSPGAAKAVVPKNGIGIAFWIAGVPGNADIVKAAGGAAPGCGRRREPTDVLRHPTTHGHRFPGRAALGHDITIGRRRSLVGGGRTCRRHYHATARHGTAPARLRESVDAGANAAVLPAFSVGSLVGFGAVVAALPAFVLVRDWVLSIGGGPLVSLAVATNVLSALTGSASGGLTIALDALGPTYMRLAGEQGIDPALLHRVAVIGAGTLDSLPHNGAVVTLLAVCGSTHTKSYVDIVMVAIVGALVALVAVIALGGLIGSF